MGEELQVSKKQDNTKGLSIVINLF